MQFLEPPSYLVSPLIAGVAARLRTCCAAAWRAGAPCMTSRMRPHTIRAQDNDAPAGQLAQWRAMEEGEESDLTDENTDAVLESHRTAVAACTGLLASLVAGCRTELGHLWCGPSLRPPNCRPFGLLGQLHSRVDICVYCRISPRALPQRTARSY